MATHTPNDEVLSALLDAEPVGSDAAHVARCAQCQDRLAELRSVAVAVGTPPAHAPPHVRTAAVGRAVAGARDDPAPPSRGAVVTPLRRRRAASGPTRRVAPLPAAAALVALIVAAGWMLTVLNTNDRTVGTEQNTAESGSGALRATIGADEAEAGGEVGLGEGRIANPSPEPGPRMDASGAAVAGIADGGDLGAVDDLAAVTRRADADLAGPRKAGRARPCRTEAEAAGTVEWQAALTYKGRAATAYVVRDDAGKQITQVWSAQDCSLIDRRTA